MGTKRRVRLREWGKNLCILLLSLSAIWLVWQATPYEGFSLLARDPAPIAAKPTEAGTLSVEPVSMVVRNAAGRYGLAYDSSTTGEIFESKLGILLREALAAASAPVLVGKADWQTVIREQEAWIYYDFLANLPLDRLPLWLGNTEKNELLFGQSRRFLISKAEGAYLLYYLDDSAESYSISRIPQDRLDPFFGAIEDFTPNTAFFAFEQPQDYAALDDNLLLFSKPPSLLVFEVTNPLAAIDDSMREALLRDLDFNPNATSAYEPADGWVLKEGTDSLRILKDGSLIFQSQSSGAPRYPVSVDDRGLLIEQLQRLLTRLTDTRVGEAALILSDIQETEDGSLQIDFAYCLNGAPVKVFDEGYAARFYVQNGSVQEFNIRLRSYTPTEEKLTLLPERLAAVGLRAKGQTGAQLIASYTDQGQESRTAAEWVID